MISTNGLTMDKNNKIGAGREHLVKQFLLKNYKWSILPSTFVDDVHHEIDIIAKNIHGIQYIQVKGFHSNWIGEPFKSLSAKAEKDGAGAYAMYVNVAGKIYVRKII